jgi:uncharacterized membrane protein
MRLAALLLALAPAAAAEPALPTLADVVGVAPGDVLNVREHPDASAPIIGTLAPDTAGVEVVDLDSTGRWARVNAGERAGWAAMRYLQAESNLWIPGALPPGLVCLGTEPFWSLRPDSHRVIYSTPEAERALPLGAALDTGLPGDPRRVLIAVDGEGRLTATIAPKTCSDGMSDRAYGLGVAVVLEGPGAPELRTGCCSIAQ